MPCLLRAIAGGAGLMGRRDSYAVVGAATRLAVGRAMDGLTLPEARVMLALVGRLTSWSTLGEPIAASQLAAETGMGEREVRRAVASLVRRGAIEREASPGRRASAYRLPDPGDTPQGSDGPNPGDSNHGSSNHGSSNHGSSPQGTLGTQPRVTGSNPGDTAHLRENYYSRTSSEEGGEREPRGLERFAAHVTTPPQKLDEGETESAYAALTAELTPDAVDAALDRLNGQRFAYPRQAADRLRQLAADTQQRASRARAEADMDRTRSIAQAPPDPRRNLNGIATARTHLRPITGGQP